MNKKPVKIAVINTHPITYFAELYEKLNESPNIELTALYFSDMGLANIFDHGVNQKVISDIELLSGYNSIFCGNNFRGKNPRGFFSLICPSIWKIIKQSDFDVIWFHGYNYFAFLIAFFAAKTSNRIILFRGETHLKLKRKKAFRWLRDKFVKFYLQKFDGLLAIGSLNFEYYLSLGMSEEKIFLTPYSVNNKRFANVKKSKSKNNLKLEKLRGLNPRYPTILFCAKFIERKNPKLMLLAFAKIQESGISANLVMTGNGPILKEMIAVSVKLGLKNIYFTGFIGQSVLPELYSKCDLFVHPSEDEPWGLVVNEVMAAGLPVIVGKEMGCAADLVYDELNGYKLSHLNSDCLVEKLQKIINDKKKLRRMGLKSKQIIEKWDHDRTVRGLYECLKMNGFDVA